MNGERIFEALSEIGDDLLHMAEQKTFGSPWKRWGTIAACIALILCLSVVVLPYFPMGCGSSMKEDAAPEAMEETEALEPEAEEEAPAEEPEAPAMRRVLWEEQWYDLEPHPTERPADLGRELGPVEVWEGPDLGAAILYEAGDGGWLYVQTEEGWYRAEPEN